MDMDSGSSLSSSSSTEFITPHRQKRQSNLLGIVQFGFQAKTSFNADDALLQTRSEKLVIKEREPNEDIWRRPPPDFRVQVYDPNPPKRNTRESMQPWLYGTIPGERTVVQKREKVSLLPVIFRQSQRCDQNFDTQFRIQRPFSAKKRFVTEGMHKAEKYNMPTKHDFRGYPPLKRLGLPEFLTSYDKDPYNLKLHTETLNHIHGISMDCISRDLVPGPQMGPAMTRQPRYEPDLILHRGSWPTKSEAYTRYRRRNRHPHSAFMERVETELTTQWTKEKMDKALEEYEQRKKAVEA